MSYKKTTPKAQTATKYELGLKLSSQVVTYLSALNKSFTYRITHADPVVYSRRGHYGESRQRTE